MAKHDIKGSKAYAKAIAQRGLLTDAELKLLLAGLDKVNDEWEAGTFVAFPSDEDIHTANERRLSEFIGSVAGKLHTGRSRNDQVATDMRLWLVEECHKIMAYLKACIQVAVDRAEMEMSVTMAGYTHLQRAQPIRWSHWLLSHTWSLHADALRLEQLMTRVNQLPLGSGALAGITNSHRQPIQRRWRILTH
jgi:argininosuccinate lyase